jgi:hypothetical protein
MVAGPNRKDAIMIKLSDAQLIILSKACQREDRLVLPLPENLKGGAAKKVVDSLLAKGLIEEIDAKRGEPIWRETGDGHGVALIATGTAFEALGIKSDGAGEKGPTKKTEGKRGKSPAKGKTPRAARADSKQAQLIAMLKRAKGASIEEIVEAFDWQPHTVRGAIAGALKKKLGLDVTSEKDEKRGRVYRIEA